MSQSFYVLTMGWVGPPRDKEVEDVLDGAGGWLRTGPSTWFIYTEKPAKHWYGHLLPTLRKDEGLIVAPVDTSGLAGSFPQWVRDWFLRKGHFAEATPEKRY